MTKFLNISTDNTLGGATPSDEVVSSQKAIKNYVDGAIPTVNNPTITITQGGVTKGSFTLNQSSGDTIALDAGGGGGSSTLAGLSDVTITSPTTDQVLTYDGSKWINAVQTGGYHPDLFDWKWADHEISDMQWLRADTFSWQNGTTYAQAYNHLVADISGKTLQTETIAGTTISFYLADDGHKVCPAAQESNVAAIYAATGVAWYYILDSDNTRFKLPRTQFGVTGLRDTVGKYVAPGLPNITSGTDWLNSTSGSASAATNGAPAQDGCFTGDSNGGHGIESNQFKIHWSRIDASGSSSIYGNSTTVQAPATQMYLYFFVGSFTQSAIENTAGLNVALFNGKADTDLMNTDANVDFVIARQEPNAGNGYTWYRKYKSGWVEQGGRATTNSGNPKLVSLPVAMADTYYNVSTLGQTSTDGYSNAAWQVMPVSTATSPKSTTGFYGQASITGYNLFFYWEVRGMAA